MSRKSEKRCRPDDAVNRSEEASVCGGLCEAAETQVSSFDEGLGRSTQVKEEISWRASTSGSSMSYVGFLEGDNGRSEFLG